jgi:hypothetical protein
LGSVGIPNVVALKFPPSPLNIQGPSKRMRIWEEVLAAGYPISAFAVVGAEFAKGNGKDAAESAPRERRSERLETGISTIPFFGWLLDH